MKFRPHHFLCTLGFEGKGYSEEFVQNYSRIATHLQSPGGDDQVIEVTSSADSICMPCPNRVDSGCTSAPKITALDEAHQEILSLKEGDRLSWREAKERIRERMTLEKFHAACAPCSWKALGVCERALKKIKGLPLVFLFLVLVQGASFEASRSYAATPSSIQVLSKAPAKSQWRSLESISPSQLFYDHAQALLARHELQEATQKLAKNKWSEAGALAQKSSERWPKIQQHSSGSPWLRRLNDELGKAELILGRVAHHKKKKSQAKVYFERAFERMSLALVRWEDVDAYMDSCGGWEKRESVDVCLLWIKRLLGVFIKSSPERKELESRWSTAIDLIERLPLAPGGGRIHQVYKSPDPDQLAWEEILPRIRERNLRWSSSQFEEFLEKFPRSTLRQKVRYWWAMALTESGPDKKALSLLEQVVRESPLSFYGLLSARQLNQDPANFLITDPPTENTRSSNLHPSEWSALERAEVLLKSGLKELASMELREIRVRESLDSEFLVYLARLHQEAGSHLGAFTVVTELIQRGSKAAATQWAAEIVFPVEHWIKIESAARAKSVDPLWVLSLMKQESAFEDQALSSSGAVGLMQVMPATALDMDPQVFRLELGDQDRNVLIGTSYLAFLTRRFKGNLALATAGYNAGPQAVERWLKEHGNRLGLVEFIESIPYRETRDYVGSIIRNYFWYSKKIKPETAPLVGGGLTPVLMPSPSPLPSGSPEPAPKNELDYFWRPIQQTGSA